MSIFKKNKENRAELSVTPEISEQLLRALIGRDYMTSEEAMAIPTVNACISLIADKISLCPIKLYQQKDGKTVEILDDRRVFLLNRDTGDTLTGTQFLKAMISDYFLSKNGAYAYINKTFNGIRSINYVDGTNVEINKEFDPIFKKYEINVQGQTFFPYQFLKILRKTKDGCTSLSVTEEMKLQIAVAYNEMTYENNLVKKGGNRKGFLRSENKLSQADMDILKDAFKNLYSNNSEESVVILNKGLDFKESSNTSVEMQLNENKTTNASEFAKLFHVPMPCLTGKSTEQDNANLISNAVMPVIQDIESSCDRDLLTVSEIESGMFFAFDTREITRGSTKERYEAYQIGLKNNFLQVDEVRDKEDLEPLGINWITLGLDQVLYDPKTKTVYTPNTNKTAELDALKGEKE